MTTRHPSPAPIPAPAPPTGPDRLTRDRIDDLKAQITHHLGLDPSGSQLIKFTNNAVVRLPAARAVIRIAGSVTAHAHIPGVLAAAQWFATHDLPTSPASCAPATLSPTRSRPRSPPGHPPPPSEPASPSPPPGRPTGTANRSVPGTTGARLDRLSGRGRVESRKPDTPAPTVEAPTGTSPTQREDDHADAGHGPAARGGPA